MWTESEVVNEWIRKGVAQGKLKAARWSLLKTLEIRFPGAVPNDLKLQIQDEHNHKLLDDWFLAALRADTFEQFLAVLKK